MSAKTPPRSRRLPADSQREHPSQPGGEPASTDRILFVDDDPGVLDGYKRLLHGEFEIDTAVGAERGLAAIHLFGPYAIVITDMCMPGMNGAEFLAQVRQTAPNTVRMLLTGYRDLNRAIEAVNEGNIFRYLTKPCAKGDLVHAIILGLAKYHANTEREELIREAKEIKIQAGDLSQFLVSRTNR